MSMPVNCEKGRESGGKSLKGAMERGKIDELTAPENQQFGRIFGIKKAALTAAFLLALKSRLAISRNDFRHFIGFSCQL